MGAEIRDGRKEVTQEMRDCEHPAFDTHSQVTRWYNEADVLEGREGKKVTAFSVAVTVSCSRCGIPFEFIGVPVGYSMEQPTANINYDVVQVPIRPSTDIPERIEGIVYN